MIDIRYHVISLVAVFLALGIGILLGTTLVERGLIAEQKAEISSLRQTFDEIKDKNESLHSDLEDYRQYAEESRAYIVPNRLLGASFAVLAKRSPDERALEGINSAVAGAGGTIPVTIEISGLSAYEDPQVRDNLASLFGMPADDNQALVNRVYLELVTQLSTASNLGILDTLEDLGLIKVNGTLSAPVSSALLLGGIDTTKVQQTDVPLIESFIQSAFPLVGVGGSKTPASVMSAYKKTGVSTVDQVETIPGQVALVLVLSGEPGNYGSGHSADRSIPGP